uniref:SMP-LTD domain-containing protein n=1 Tax=Ciona intestinalis TaxID=7719 RepID=F6UAH7_CIOIN
LNQGWMNEAFFYDPQTYHISNTQAAFITLDGNTLRIQTPQKNISRRSTYKEGNIPISNVIHQRLFDITFAKVYLKPEGLVKKRVWSKKYPICVEIPVKDQNKMKSKTTSLETDEQAKDTMNENVDVKDMECLYLFGRTDRQKEEWFYRSNSLTSKRRSNEIQRAINVALARHKVNKTEPNQKEGNVSICTNTSNVGMQCTVRMPWENEPLLNIEDEWGIIEENHYEEVCIKNVSLFELSSYKLCKFSLPFMMKSVDVGIQEPGLDVAWINALLGRITFDFLRQPSWAKWLSIKIQKKLDKIKLPYFMDELKLTEMNLGSTVPLVHQISLPRLDAQGLWLEMEVTYIGTVQMTLKTKLVLTKLGKQEPVLKVDKNSLSGSSAITDSDAEDSAESSDDEDESTVSRIVGQGNPNPLTPPTAGAAPPKKWVRIVDSIAKSKYFQRATESEFIRKKLETVSNTPMMLSVELLQLRGVLAINIPPPPTDRIWYGFREPPNMVIKAHPQVGERLVRTSHVTDWIENKLQQEFVKVLVMPNMDDIPIPVMFNNRTSS